MKTILLLLLLIMAHGVNGQLKKIKEYPLEDGRIIVPGDSLMIGEESGAQGNYQYILTKPSVFVPAAYNLGAGYKGARYEITELQDIENAAPGLKSGIAIIKMGKQKLMISLDQAIEEGEVFLIK